MSTTFVVGLTGGVASGKSEVANRFAALGIVVADADVAAREALARGSEGLAETVTAFGTDILAADGGLDRAAMRRRVFADPAARGTLEAIIHPRVRAWLRERAETGGAPYCLLAIPLLAENITEYRWVDRVLVVDVPESVQLARLIARDGVDETLARRMIEQQASRADRLALADDVIDNRGDESALDQAVAELHQRYLTLT